MAKKSGARITGQKQVQKNLKAAQKRWEKALAGAIYLEGNNIMGISKRLVPVDTGTLRASGYVTNPQQQGSKTVVEMGFGGGFSGKYAASVHERLDVNHPEGGQAKFLEQPVRERESQVVGNVKTLAQRLFKANQGAPKGPLPTDPDSGEQGGG